MLKTIRPKWPEKPYEVPLKYKSNEKKMNDAYKRIDAMKRDKFLIHVRNNYEYKLIKKYAEEKGVDCEKYESSTLKEKKVVEIIYKESWCSSCEGTTIVTNKYVPTLYAKISKRKNILNN